MLLEMFGRFTFVVVVSLCGFVVSVNVRGKPRFLLYLRDSFIRHIALFENRTAECDGAHLHVPIYRWVDVTQCISRKFRVPIYDK